MQRVGKGWQWTNLKTSLLIALSRHAYPYALAYPRAHFSVLRLTANDPLKAKPPAGRRRQWTLRTILVQYRTYRPDCLGS